MRVGQGLARLCPAGRAGMLQRMNIAALFIRRPVATALIMLGMLFFGAASYVNLPVNQLPNVDFPTIQVMRYNLCSFYANLLQQNWNLLHCQDPFEDKETFR